MKKIVPKTMNLAYQIWLHKKRSLGRQQNVTQKKNPRNTTKCHNIFAISFIPNYGRSQFDIIILFFKSTAFSQQILGEKLLLVLKLCIKNKQTKRQHEKIVCENLLYYV